MSRNRERLSKINASRDVTEQNTFYGQNEFNYAAWDNKEASIKLLSVTWESDYKNAVNWEEYGVEGRDAWFKKEHPGELLIHTGWNIKSAMQWVPAEGKFTGEIYIDEPIENIRQYNYLYLQDYEKPVPYNTDKKVTDYFYFITAANAVAANTTQLYLSVDAWTMFFNEANIVSVNLDRGHWAHKQIEAVEFLENPLDAPVDLTTPEPDLPSVKPMVSYSNLLSLTNSEPRVCVATVASFENDRLGIQWAPTGTHDWANPFSGEYSGGDDTIDGYARTLGIHGEFKPGDAEKDEGGSGGVGQHNQPAPHVWTPEYTINKDQNPGDVRVYSTDLNTFEKFIIAVRENLPHLLDTIKAFYVLPADLIDEGEEFRLASFMGDRGYNLKFKRVFPQPQAQKLADIEITNELFGFDEDAAEFAKIYTSQFAQLRLNDFQGNSALLGVEELAGDLEFYARASSTFPFLKVQAFLNGVGGNTEKTYNIRPLHDMEAQGFNSKWTEFMWNLDIPTFTVEASQKEINGNYNIDKWRTISENAKIDAENAMISADNSFENTKKNIQFDYNTGKDKLDQNKLFTDLKIAHAYNWSIRDASLTRGIANDNAELAHENTSKTLDKNLQIEESNIRHRLGNGQNLRGTVGDQNISNRLNARTANNASDRTAEISLLNAYWQSFSNSQDNYYRNLHFLWREIDNEQWANNQQVTSDRQSNLREYAQNYDQLIVSRDSSTMNIDNAYEEARLNGKTAEMLYSFNTFSANVENMLGVQGSLLSMAHSFSSSAIGTATGGIVAGLSGGGVLGAAGATAAGIVSTANSLITGMAQVELSQASAVHQHRKTEIQTSLLDAWSESKEITYEESIEGNDDDFKVSFQLAPGKSLMRTLADNRRQLDRDLRTLNFDHGLKQARANRDTRSDIIERDYRTRGGLLSGRKSRTEIILEETFEDEKKYAAWQRDADQDIREVSFNSQENIINETFRMAEDIRNRDRGQELWKAGHAYDIDKDIADETLYWASLIADRTFDQSEEKAEETRDLDTEINQDGYYLDKMIIEGKKEKDEEIADKIYEQDYRKLNNDYEKSMNSLITETNQSRHGKPYSYGESSTENANIFGQWGLDVTVERISKAAEKDVAAAFRKYGYRLPGTLVEQPELGQMSNFTYWQCSDAWIVAPELADSLALIIKNMFLEGVTLWNDADAVRLTPIKENK